MINTIIVQEYVSGRPPTDHRSTTFDQPIVDIVLLNMDMLLSSTNYGTMGRHMIVTIIANNQD